jgi:hypothetical protein
VRVCVCVCVHMRMCVWVHVRARARGYARGCVRAEMPVCLLYVCVPVRLSVTRVYRCA